MSFGVEQENKCLIFRMPQNIKIELNSLTIQSILSISAVLTSESITERHLKTRASFKTLNSVIYYSSATTSSADFFKVPPTSSMAPFPWLDCEQLREKHVILGENISNSARQHGT